MARRAAASRSGALHLDALWRAAGGRLLQLKLAAEKALELGAAVPRREEHIGEREMVALRTLLIAARAATGKGHRPAAEAHGRATDALRDRTRPGVYMGV